jgi:hypothetical protein
MRLGLRETARAKTRLRKLIRKVTYTRHTRLEFAQKDGIRIRLATQWLTYTSCKSSIMRFALRVISVGSRQTSIGRSSGVTSLATLSKKAKTHALARASVSGVSEMQPSHGTDQSGGWLIFDCALSRAKIGRASCGKEC